ncbi:hypothetical protein HDU86_008307 [Geranomyces michiganensis]|nr:hypothetical protein HDU86_008307 [Geranomyces michiganensis]
MALQVIHHNGIITPTDPLSIVSTAAPEDVFYLHAKVTETEYRDFQYKLDCVLSRERISCRKCMNASGVDFVRPALCKTSGANWVLPGIGVPDKVELCEPRPLNKEDANNINLYIKATLRRHVTSTRKLNRTLRQFYEAEPQTRRLTAIAGADRPADYALYMASLNTEEARFTVQTNVFEGLEFRWTKSDGDQVIGTAKLPENNPIGNRTHQPAYLSPSGQRGCTADGHSVQFLKVTILASTANTLRVRAVLSTSNPLHRVCMHAPGVCLRRKRFTPRCPAVPIPIGPLAPGDKFYGIVTHTYVYYRRPNGRGMYSRIVERVTDAQGQEVTGNDKAVLFGLPPDEGDDGEPLP